MTPLTHRLQVVVATVFWRMIKVRRSQDDLRASHRIRIAMHRLAAPIMVNAAFPLAFAAPLRPLKADTLADRLPVLRISSAVLWRYRH